MAKSKKHTNIFRELAAMDARQQYEVRRRSTRRAPKVKPGVETLSSRAKTILLIASLALPWVGWTIGVVINPSGWLSTSPDAVLWIIMIFSTYYWYISIPWAILIICLLIMKRSSIAAVVVFVTSFVASLFILNGTDTASESEFTG